ncbi:uncharacterized protein [Haliotis cracherodii]|uniref:uncharacterized protein n=1 Tax=Haliotis cracherodii TaxID=6455 RepID=UPI0039EA0D6E
MQTSSYVQDLMATRFPQVLVLPTTPVSRRRCVTRPHPLSLLPSPVTSLPDPVSSVSVNITGQVIMDDTDFIEILLCEDDDTRVKPQSFLRAFLSRVINMIKRVFTSNKMNA